MQIGGRPLGNGVGCAGDPALVCCHQHSRGGVLPPGKARNQAPPLPMPPCHPPHPQRCVDARVGAAVTARAVVVIAHIRVQAAQVGRKDELGVVGRPARAYGDLGAAGGGQGSPPTPLPRRARHAPGHGLAPCACWSRPPARHVSRGRGADQCSAPCCAPACPAGARWSTSRPAPSPVAGCRAHAAGYGALTTQQLRPPGGPKHTPVAPRPRPHPTAAGSPVRSSCSHPQTWRCPRCPQTAARPRRAAAPRSRR